MIHLGFLLLLVGAALLPDRRGCSLAVLASVASGLGLAGRQAGPSSEVSALPPSFAAVEAALLTVGAALALAAVVSTARRDRSREALAGAGATAGGAVGIALSAKAYLVAARGGPFVIALVAVFTIGLLLVAAGRLRPGAAPPAHRALTPAAAGIVGTGALAAAIGPWTGLVFIGTILAAVGGWTAQRGPDSRPLPFAPLLTLGLIPAWWLMATIAGPEGLAIGSLPDLPWSPAAERLLAPALLVAAWAASGLWPLHREEPTAFTAPVGALLFIRVAVPAVPEGLEHWRAAAMPILVVGLWCAVLSRRWTTALAALAWIGLVAIQPAGQVGAALLMAAGLMLELERLAGLAARSQRIVRVPAALLAGVGALLAIEAGLRVEVVYTVMAAGALVMAVGRAGRVDPSQGRRHISPLDG